MRVLIIGGTGLLGAAAAIELSARGHEVTVASRSASLPRVPELDGVLAVRLDLDTASPGRLREVLGGHEALVYAVGPDERAPYPLPARDHLRTRMLEPTARAVSAARDTGIASLVILGSYFAAWDRMHPELGFRSRHAYVHARTVQADQTLEFAARHDMQAVVLEIPYVFGALPGRLGVFKEWVFERVRRKEVILYPRGGTTVTSVAQVARAVAGAVGPGVPSGNYPVGDANWTWEHLIGVIAEGLGVRRRVVTVPRVLAEPAALRLGLGMRLAGTHSGLDPSHLMRDIMYQRIYVDFEPSRRVLGFGAGNVEDALERSLELCYGTG